MLVRVTLCMANCSLIEEAVVSRLLALALTSCCAVFVSSATASPLSPSGTETRCDVVSLVQRAACASRRAGLDGSAELTGVLRAGFALRDACVVSSAQGRDLNRRLQRFFSFSQVA